MKHCTGLIALILLATLHWHDASADTPAGPLKAPPMQDWQVRRAKLDHTIIAARQNDPEALKQLDEILTDMEKHPHDRTPMEVLDVVGTYYLPNEGIEKSLTVIATQLVLGWYDVLRFASQSGRAEIIDNEQFFSRAWMLSGKDVTAKSFTFLKDHPDKVSQLVKEGIMVADQFRDLPSYDRHWPSGYGLDRMLCASGDPGQCRSSAGMPKEQWDAAWAESKKAVASYFVVKP